MADVNDVFNPNPEDVQLDLGFNDLVGDDKKYKDPDALAKAYANIEAHARKIEAENARIRAERDSQLATQNNNQNPPQGQEQPRQPDPANPAPHPEAPKAGEVDFRSQIREEFSALTEAQKAAANMEATAQKLVENYGSPLEANRALQKRAQELGVSVDWLRDSAARSPAAFYATMGITPNGQRSTNTPAPGSDVRLNDQSAQKNFEFYDKLRKDNPKLYFSAATQREMLNAAKAQGADFYKR